MNAESAPIRQRQRYINKERVTNIFSDNRGNEEKTYVTF